MAPIPGGDITRSPSEVFRHVADPPRFPGGRRIEIETLKLVGKGAYRRIDRLIRTLPTQSR